MLSVLVLLVVMLFVVVLLLLFFCVGGDVAVYGCMSGADGVNIVIAVSYTVVIGDNVCVDVAACVCCLL